MYSHKVGGNVDSVGHPAKGGLLLLGRVVGAEVVLVGIVRGSFRRVRALGINTVVLLVGDDTVMLRLAEAGDNLIVGGHLRGKREVSRCARGWKEVERTHCG